MTLKKRAREFSILTATDQLETYIISVAVKEQLDIMVRL